MAGQKYESYPVLHELTQTYDKYLAPRTYIASLQEGIIQINDKAKLALAAFGATGQWKLTENIRSDPEILSYDLSQLRNGMHSLGADFNTAMGGVLVIFEMARPEYRAMFDKLINIFKRDRKVEAEGRLRDGLKAYRDGCRLHDKPELFSESLRHLNVVIDKYREVPLVYFHIGHIYHYQDKIRNFRRALDNYLLCFSLAKADPDQSLLAGQAAFFAGWLTAAVLGDMQAAIEMTKNALTYDSQLGEAHYHLAKIYGAFGDTREALVHLQEAIGSFDRRYCHKILLDSDFRMIRNELKKMLYDLAEKDILEHETWLNAQGDALSSVLRLHAEDKLDYARQLLETNDYEKIATAVGLLDELKRKLANQAQEQELTEEEKEQRRRQEEEQRKAEEEELQRATEEARMKEELKKRIEEEMKARIIAERKRERTKRFIKGLVSDVMLIALAFSIGSFVFYGATTIGFVLSLITCVLFIIWVYL